MEKVRIDKWLWAARFFKTRSLAATAVSGGKVHVNGQRVKSSKYITVGDELEITKGQFHAVIHVYALGEKRGPAKEANTLYQETEESLQKRELEATQRKVLNASMPRALKKPNKKQIRQLRKLSGKS